MYSKEEMEIKLGSYSNYDFQYRQVSNLVKTLQQQYDVFRLPLTLFESLAINIQDQKRVLAQ